MLRPKLQKDKRVKPRSAGAATKSHGRSARGMLYENETMRLRTLEMASEADRHSGDVRRLRRENERLKQQMYAARDDRERLERFVDELEQLAVESGAVQQPTNAATSSSSSDNHRRSGSQPKDDEDSGIQQTSDSARESQLVSAVSMNDLHSLVIGCYGHLNIDRLLDVALDLHADRLNGCVLALDGTFPGSSAVTVTNNNHAQRRYSANSSSTLQCVATGSPLDPEPGRLVLLRCASVEPLTVVFTVRDCAALVALSVCDVVDELQHQYGTGSDLPDESDVTSSLPSLDVQCVRLDGDAVFITCGSRSDVDRLLSGGLQVRSHHVQLSDVMTESVVVEVGGIPVHVSDENVRALVSTFGTTIGPVERQLYRGVDAGRRRVRVRLRKEVSLPQTVTVAGNKLTVHVVADFDPAIGCIADTALSSVSTCSKTSEVRKVPNGSAGAGKSLESSNACAPFSAVVDKTSSGRVISSLLRLQPPSYASEETRVKHRVKPFIRSPTSTGHSMKAPQKLSLKLTDNGVESGHTALPARTDSTAGEIKNCSVDSVSRRRAPQPPGAPQNGTATGSASFSLAPPIVDPLRAKLAQRCQYRQESWHERRPSDEVSDLAGDRRDSDLAGSVTSSKQLAPDCKSASSQDSAELPWCGCWGMCCF